MLSRPVSSIDPFSHEFLRDPYPHHEVLRETGPAVWLEQYGLWLERFPEGAAMASAKHHSGGRSAAAHAHPRRIDPDYVAGRDQYPARNL
jgi:hypothetical protein